MSALSGKWAMLLLHELRDGSRLRFGELRRRVAGISEKMLTQELRRLVDDGLVGRHDYREVPPRVDYAITELGRAGLPVIDAVAAFGGRLLAVGEVAGGGGA